MKVLFIAQPFPYPPDTGSRNLVFHWLDAASRMHDVDLLWIGDRGEGKDCIPELPSIRVRAIQALPRKELSARLRRFASAIAQGVPPTSLVGMTRSVRNEILGRVRAGGYDVVVLSENVVAGYASLVAPLVPVVLFKHSIQAVDAKDARRRYGMLHPRWKLEEWMVKRFEAKTCRAAAVVCAVNAEDAADLVRRYSLAAPIEVTPIGVDLSKFPSRQNDPGGQVIGFFGNLSWGANLDAVTWFVEHILPKVWMRLPSARFRIIGPGSEHITLGNDDSRIERFGRSHIPNAMSDATIGVVPVVSGTGVRLKLLEMLSLGVPVVTTSLGALGTGCVHQEHTLIADDADSFAAAAIGLLESKSLREKLTRAGRDLVQKHSWQVLYPHILGALEKARSRYHKAGVPIGAAATQEAS